MIAALNVAVAKARRASARDDEITVAGDTLVVADNRILGKPVHDAEATAMLRQLRGRPHVVLTGVALRAHDDREWGAVVQTRVLMRAYSDEEIAAYIGRKEPFDKAGGYAIQDSEFRPVETLDGCYLNVVGLPLCAVMAGLEALGVEVQRRGSLRAPCELCRQGAQRFSN